MGLALEAKLPGVENEWDHEHRQTYEYEIVTQTWSYVKMENGMDNITEMISLTR